MSKMAHFYPNVVWQDCTFKQLNGYLLRINELYQRELSQIESMQEREMRTYRMENNI